MKKPKDYKMKDWLAVAVVLALLFFAFKCGRDSSKPEKEIITIPAKEQEREQAKDEVVNKVNNDSFINVIKLQEKNTSKLLDRYDNLMQAYLTQVELSKEGINEVVPDTCLQYQKKVKGEFDKIISSNAAKDSTAKKTISSLQLTNKSKDNFLIEKDRQYRQLKTRWDTCISNTKKLEQIVKDNKPKREVFIGAELVGNPNNYFYGYGVNLSYKTKKGVIIELGAMQLRTTTNYSIGLKTRLFKF